MDRGQRARLSRTALVLGLLGAIAMMAEGAMIDWSAVYMRDVVRVAVDREGWAFAGFSAAMAVVRVAGDRINAWCGAHALLRLSATIAVAGCALMALAPGLITGVAGATLIGIGAANCVPLVCAAAARIRARWPERRKRDGDRGRIVLIAGFCWGPPLVGGLSEIFSLQVGIGVIGILLLAVVATPLPGPKTR